LFDENRTRWATPLAQLKLLIQWHPVEGRNAPTKTWSVRWWKSHVRKRTEWQDLPCGLKSGGCSDLRPRQTHGGAPKEGMVGIGWGYFWAVHCSGFRGLRISYQLQSTLRAFNQPKKAKRS